MKTCFMHGYCLVGGSSLLSYHFLPWDVSLERNDYGVKVSSKAKVNCSWVTNTCNFMSSLAIHRKILDLLFIDHACYGWYHFLFSLSSD